MPDGIKSCFAFTNSSQAAKNLLASVTVLVLDSGSKMFLAIVGDGQSALISGDPHARTYDGKTYLAPSRLSP